MYKFIKIISFFIRQFVLPNPFKNMMDPTSAFIVNLLLGGAYVFLSYKITGTWYISRKENWWKGSLGFFFNYAILTFATLGVSYMTHNIYWIICSIICIFLVLYIFERKIFAKIEHPYIEF